MQSLDTQIASPNLSRWPRRLGMAAVAAAFALAVLLSVRHIAGFDIGYHLAYGEHFLQTGHIVQTNEFIYTRFSPTILADPDNLGPGNTYDPATNTYHFINANWLSQAVMALVYRVDGVNGLIVLQAALVACLFALLLAVLRQAGVGWTPAAAAMLLTALVSYERFILRPELFGYVILLGQWLLLTRRPFALRQVIGVIALQLLAVNVHSYFLPSVALAVAMLADELLRAAWAKWVAGKPVAAERKTQAKWLGVAIAGMVVICLANPWTWRGAIFPIQTLQYLSRHHITGQEAPTGPVHPWAVIGELFSPFAPGVANTLATWAYYAMLGLAGVAAAAGLLRRRWGLLLALGGMLSVSLSLRRNMALSAIIVIPCAAAILLEACLWLAGWRAQRRARALPKPNRSGQPPLPAMPLAPAWLTIAAAAVLLAAGLGLSAWTVTNGLYFQERRSWRFDSGWSRMVVPVSAAKWINLHQPAGRIFADQESSSNLMFLTRPHREMPVLTNTFAFPPYLMGIMLDLDNGRRDFDSMAAACDVQTVVLNNNNGKSLLRHLADSKDWAVVDLDVAHVTFVRRSGPNAALADAGEICPESLSLNMDRFVAKVASADPVPAFALHNAAMLLRQMGWDKPALDLWQRCIALRPDYAEPRNMLGMALAWRGTRTLLAMMDAYNAGRIDDGDKLKAQGQADWERARELFTQAMQLKSDYADARQNLSLLESQMADFRNGRVAVPAR